MEKTEIKKEEGVVSIPPVDYQAELAAKDAELVKVREEKENYRKGMLKAKGKPADSGKGAQDGELSLEEKIAEAVKAQMLDSAEVRIQREKDEVSAKILKENRELRLAMANKSQISNGSVGASSETTIESKAGQFFSDAQLADLKKRGFDDKKIEMLKKNILKSPVR